jgi:hypothetical protein
LALSSIGHKPKKASNAAEWKILSAEARSRLNTVDEMIMQLLGTPLDLASPVVAYERDTVDKERLTVLEEWATIFIEQQHDEIEQMSKTTATLLGTWRKSLQQAKLAEPAFEPEVYWAQDERAQLSDRPRQDNDDDDVDVAPKAGHEDDVCVICGSGEDDENMLLCDGCDLGHHLYCVRPKLHAIPEGDWFCGQCTVAKAEKLPGVSSISAVAADADADFEDGQGGQPEEPEGTEPEERDEKEPVEQDETEPEEHDSEHDGGPQEKEVAEQDRLDGDAKAEAGTAAEAAVDDADTGGSAPIDVECDDCLHPLKAGGWGLPGDAEARWCEGCAVVHTDAVVIRTVLDEDEQEDEYQDEDEDEQEEEEEEQQQHKEHELGGNNGDPDAADATAERAAAPPPHAPPPCWAEDVAAATDAQRAELFGLLGGPAHSGGCASPALCAICGLQAAPAPEPRAGGPAGPERVEMGGVAYLMDRASFLVFRPAPEDWQDGGKEVGTWNPEVRTIDFFAPPAVPPPHVPPPGWSKDGAAAMDEDEAGPAAQPSDGAPVRLGRAARDTTTRSALTAWGPQVPEVSKRGIEEDASAESEESRPEDELPVEPPAPWTLRALGKRERCLVPVFSRPGRWRRKYAPRCGRSRTCGRVAHHPPPPPQKKRGQCLGGRRRGPGVGPLPRGAGPRGSGGATGGAGEPGAEVQGGPERGPTRTLRRRPRTLPPANRGPPYSRAGPDGAGPGR